MHRKSFFTKSGPFIYISKQEARVCGFSHGGRSFPNKPCNRKEDQLNPITTLASSCEMHSMKRCNLEAWLKSLPTHTA